MYCIPIILEGRDSVMFSSGQMGARIEYVDASVDAWIGAGTFDTPLTADGNSYEF